jgi:hypothetical protein
MELTTDRLLLRGFHPDDLDELHILVGDPLVTRHTFVGTAGTAGNRREIRAMMRVAQEGPRTRGSLVVTDRSTSGPGKVVKFSRAG